MNRLVLAAVLATISTAALAQSQEDQQACMDDAFRVCGAFIPDRGRVTACMVENKSKLSSACQMVMNKYAPPANASTAVAASKPAMTTKPAAIRTAQTTARPGKPLSITPR